MIYMHFICISILIILSQLFVTCKQNELVSPIQNENTDINKSPFYCNNSLSTIGDLHNEGLDSCFKYLKRNLSHIKNKKDFKEYTNLAMNNFLRAKNIVINEDIYSKSITFASNKMYNNITHDDLKSLGYSNNQINYLTRLFLIFDKEYSNVQAMKDSLNEFNYDVSLNLEYQETQPILSASSVMMSSTAFWNQHDISNIQKQIDKTKKIKSVKMQQMGLKEIIEADIVAAVGAVIPCIGATVGYFACVGGAALGASFAMAVLEYIEYLWDEYGDDIYNYIYDYIFSNY